MEMIRNTVAAALALGWVLGSTAVTWAADVPQLAPAPTLTKGEPGPVGKEVIPILAHNCFSCHANGKRKGGLEIISRETLLKGGKNGPAVVPGKSGVSLLIQRVT